MNNPSKYTKELIEKGKKMYRQGFSPSVICAELGFENQSAVLYHCKEGNRKKQMLFVNNWRKKHPDIIRKIQKKASKKWAKKNPERYKEIVKRTYLKNIDKRLAYYKKYNQEHREEIYRKNHLYYQKNRKNILKKQKEYRISLKENIESK